MESKQRRRVRFIGLPEDHPISAGGGALGFFQPLIEDEVWSDITPNQRRALMPLERAGLMAADQPFTKQEYDELMLMMPLMLYLTMSIQDAVIWKKKYNEALLANSCLVHRCLLLLVFQRLTFAEAFSLSESTQVRIQRLSLLICDRRLTFQEVTAYLDDPIAQRAFAAMRSEDMDFLAHYPDIMPSISFPVVPITHALSIEEVLTLSESMLTERLSQLLQADSSEKKKAASSDDVCLNEINRASLGRSMFDTRQSNVSWCREEDSNLHGVAPTST